MADPSASIETMEHRLMRSWIAGDFRALKALTSRKFRLVAGTSPCVMLDAKSWLEAAAERFRCTSYRFGDLYIHDLGLVVVFATQMEAETSIDGHPWSGKFWITDVWHKGKLRRSWRIAERLISRVESDAAVPAAFQSLQLWGRGRSVKPTASSDSTGERIADQDRVLSLR